MSFGEMEDFVASRFRELSENVLAWKTNESDSR
jgi:hypothetical protein